jgi:putative transposase
VENEFEILEMECDKDHVHLLVDCSPQHFIPNIIKAMKGISARHMFKKHPEIKNRLWGGSLWNPSYYVSTVSDTTEEQIRRYIQSQKEK